MEKGIILAGGKATRLFPATLSISKQLLPIYDKPTIYYPLTTLLLAGIKDILIISTPRDITNIANLLGAGLNLGIKISYTVQTDPRGLADAFLLAEKTQFITKDDPCALILGDNVFYGNMSPLFKHIDMHEKNGEAVIFAYKVKNYQDYGIVELDNEDRAIKLIEKPKEYFSNWAVTGLYFYPAGISEIAKQIKPSARGELEITDINNIYLKNNKLVVKRMNRGYAWFDTGTPESMLETSTFIRAIEKRTNQLIGCPEEVAVRNKWITKKQMLSKLPNISSNDYYEYLKSL